VLLPIQRNVRAVVDRVRPWKRRAAEEKGYSTKFTFLRLALDSIRIRGARTHNLRNIALDLPRNRLIVITGISGSGKSSLAFDTLYAEGQRRYVESRRRTRASSWK
jgi:ABC-type glutathione transport system ATPase component